MALRLTHVLVLMALVLAAGVLSVQGLEGGAGGPAAQGTIVIAAPALSLEGAQALVRGRSDARWTVIPSRPQPLSPFDEDRVSDAAAGGAVTALFVQPPAAPAAPDVWREAWRVLIAPAEGDVARSLLDFVRAQAGTRPFLAGLVLPEGADAGELAALLDELCAAADDLPSFRRTTIVLLGQRQPGSGVRVSVRLDRGRTGPPAPVTLVDLLERER